MRKLILTIIGIGILNLAQAVTIVSNTTLSGGTAYIYQGSATLATGTSIASATITFNNVYLSSPGSAHNVFYYDVIDTGTKTGTISFSAAENNYSLGQDYFTQSSTYGGSKSAQIGSTLPSVNNFNVTGAGNNGTGWGAPNYFPVSTSENASWSTDITGTALTYLGAEMSAGYFDIGFNPNCPYTFGSITLTWTTRNNQSVPDQAMTASLLGMSLLGLTLFRRKLTLD